MNEDDQTEAPADGVKKGKSPFAEHSRSWDTFAYVYPVVSRRSRGLSVGINLNPDTICNFDCVYCQVKKIEPPRPVPVVSGRLREELDALLCDVASGAVWRHPRFADVDPGLKRLSDIAFSGDGEPTAAPRFAEAVDIVVDLKRAHGLEAAKIVLITNATLLDRPGVEAVLRIMDANRGEVWAKLDAGTQAYYDRVDRSAVPLQRVLENILACGTQRPIVIQSMFMQMHGRPMPEHEFSAYTDRITELIEAGCRIERIQLYTVAREPLESYVSALTDEQLAGLGDRLRERLDGIGGGAGVGIEVFGAEG